MTKKEFEKLQGNEIILRGKRRAKIIGLGSSYIEFQFLDTKRKSLRGYRGLKLAGESTGSELPRDIDHEPNDVL